jgi:N-acyl-D-amino-acid deacylase
MKRKRLLGILVLPFCVVSSSIAQKTDHQKQTARSALRITGEALPGLEELDRAMLATLRERGIPGAALAIAKDGRLVLARGYGLADLEAKVPVQPAATLFNLASVTKSVTAVAVLKLVDEGKLRLDDYVFTILKRLQPLPGDRMDPRIKQITVRQLLLHAGGWDRTKSGDPQTQTRKAADHLHVSLPITHDQLIIHMLGQPLDFTPGTHAVYSNFGYQLLSHVIEEVTGQNYEGWVQKNVLAPMGISDMSVDKHAGYLDNEARRYLAGHSEPASAVRKDLVGSGGWKASAVDMARFLTALDGSRGQPILSNAALRAMLGPPPPPLKLRPTGAFFGLGWDAVKRSREGIDYHKNGGIAGISTFIEHMPNGVDFAVLFNWSRDRRGAEEDRAREQKGAPWGELKAEIERLRQWPRGNLWRKYASG